MLPKTFGTAGHLPRPHILTPASSDQTGRLEGFDDFYASFAKIFTGQHELASLDLIALSSDRFVRQINDRPGLFIGRVRLILPCYSALAQFYASSRYLIPQQNIAIQNLEDQMVRALRLWNAMRANGKIGDFSHYYTPAFSWTYLAVVNDEQSMSGHFYPSNEEAINGIRMGLATVYGGAKTLDDANWFQALLTNSKASFR